MTAWEVAASLAEGASDLRRRATIGERCMALAHDGPWTGMNEPPDVERDSAAKDAISDILTALFGPSGIWFAETQRIAYNQDAASEAWRILDAAYRSWEGDAEDYVRRAPS